jgi:hypothetical protein
VLSRTLVVDTFGSGKSDTVLAAFTGTKGNLTEVACDDDTSGGTSSLQSQIVFPVEGGTTYYIMVASWSSSAGGNVRVNIDSQGDENSLFTDIALKCYQAKIAKRSARFQRQTVFTFDANLRIRAETTVTGLSLYCNQAGQKVLDPSPGGLEGPSISDPEVPLEDL